MKPTDESLLSAIERHEQLADSYGNLSESRSTALDYYLGRPMGNEVDGRSHVISRDVYDNVEWIKPQMADIFCGGDEVVSFTPHGPEDVKAAEQESDYVNYILTEKNDWFTVWNGWSHDALLQKVGYVIAYWDEGEDRTKEKYKGLTDDELALLLQDQEVVPVEHEEMADEYGQMIHDVTVERVKQYGCVRVENVAPERVLVSANARGLCLQDRRLDFLEYWEYKTISELRDEGFKVDDDLQDDTDNTQDWQDSLRDDNNPFRYRNEGEESSPAARRLKVRNVWIRYDSDGDGRTELRRVIVVGKTILEDDDCDLVTLVALCPIPLPHQHTGLSVADAVLDLQQIKTALLRGSLDNVYLANNGRHAVDFNRVNLDDMLVTRPGGVVRVDGPLADAILPLNHSTTGDVGVKMMEYTDRIMAKRTGVSEQTQGLDPNALNNSAGAHANSAMITAQMQRIKFIARVFAETGVRELFRIVHALTLKHGRKADMVKLRNQWIQVDPRHWVKRTDMSVAAALGTGDRPQQIMFLSQQLQMQMGLVPLGLANPLNIYNTVKRLTRAGGFKDETEFWTDPAKNPPPNPGPPPELLKEQAKAQAAMQMKQAEIQAEMQIKQAEHQLKMREIEANLALQQSNDVRDSERERMKAEVQAQLEAQRITLEEWKAQLQAQVTQYTTDQNNATKLQIAGFQAEKDQETEVMRLGHDANQKDADRQNAVDLHDTGKRNDSNIQATKSAMDQLTKAMAQLAEMQKQIVQGQQSLEKAVRAKRVLVRDAQGKPTHSEIRE